MRKLSWAIPLAIAAFVSGCRPGESPKTADDSHVARNVKPPQVESAPPSMDQGAERAVPGDGKFDAPTLGSSTQPRTAPNSRTALPKNVPQLSQDRWGPSDKSAMQIATEADMAIASMRGISAETMIRLNDSAGYGGAKSKLQVQDPTHYQVEYIELENGQPHTFREVADGNKRAVLKPSAFIRKGGWEKKEITKPFAVGPNLTDQWIGDFPKLTLAPLLDGHSAFQPLLKSLGAKYKVTAEKRVTNFHGREMTDYRIVGVNKDQNLGESRLEMIFNAEVHFPVTIRTSRKPIKGPATEILWSTAWAPKSEFNPKIFEVPESL